MSVVSQKSAAPTLVYGGEESFARSGIAVRSWHSVCGAEAVSKIRRSGVQRRVRKTDE